MKNSDDSRGCGRTGGLRTARIGLAGGLLWGLAAAASAHEPVARCVLLDPQTVRCRGGYDEGEDAPETKFDVIAHDGTVLVDGKLGKDSLLTFPRPTQRYYVLFDVGPGHQMVIEDEEIGPPPRSGWKAAWTQR